MLEVVGDLHDQFWSSSPPPPSLARRGAAEIRGGARGTRQEGDFKDGVLKVNIPCTDLKVTIGKRPAPPVRLRRLARAHHRQRRHRGDDGRSISTEDEVNPVMSALLDQGLDATALHNHFHETPRVFFMHVHGMGSAEELARRVKPAVGLIDRAVASAPAPPPPPAAPAAPIIDGAALTKIIGHPGEQNGPVYKITIGRGDLDVREHGAAINARMGLNTWAASSPEPMPTPWSPATSRCSPAR